MSTPPRPAPAHVPTLTEVIEFDPVPLPHAEPEASSALPSAPEPSLFATLNAGALQASPLTPLPADTSVLPSTASPLADAGMVLPVPPPGTPAEAPQPIVAPMAPLPLPAAGRGPEGGVDEAQLAQRVLADVQRQIDGMLEYRLRQALTPILARTAEALVRELRQDLSKTMRDVVSRAVAQEIARQRPRG